MMPSTFLIVSRLALGLACLAGVGNSLRAHEGRGQAADQEHLHMTGFFNCMLNSRKLPEVFLRTHQKPHVFNPSAPAERPASSHPIIRGRHQRTLALMLRMCMQGQTTLLEAETAEESRPDLALAEETRANSRVDRYHAAATDQFAATNESAIDENHAAATDQSPAADEPLAGSSNQTEQIRFQFAPTDWQHFLANMGFPEGNLTEWHADTPVPKAPPYPCWFIPCWDKVAVRLAELQQEFRDAGWKVLTCDPDLIKTLSNKVKLRDHVEKLRQLHLMPHHWKTPEEATYPCVLKGATGEFGKNVYLVKSIEEVYEIAKDGFDGTKWLLQEHIKGSMEYSTTLLVVDGEILDAIVTEYEYQDEVYIWPRVRQIYRHSHDDVPLQQLGAMSLIMQGFSGICNFNYKVRPNGRMVIFEVNPRVGGDLVYDVPSWRSRALFEKLDRLSRWEGPAVLDDMPIGQAITSAQSIAARERIVAQRVGQPKHHTGEHDAHAKAHHMLNCVKHWGMPINLNSYNAAISICEQNGQAQRALLLLNDMRGAGITPNAITYSAAITACEKGRHWQQMFSLLDDMRMAGVTLNTVSFGASFLLGRRTHRLDKLSDGCVQCGSFKALAPDFNTEMGFGRQGVYHYLYKQLFCRPCWKKWEAQFQKDAER
mmetsp:Transcript_168371/g.323483  ORF Transcript_168371/g.323483 Transcript_168371/m.323483 type:complete len:655 (+) Transcript_168371:110-2074(+)